MNVREEGGRWAHSRGRKLAMMSLMFSFVGILSSGSVTGIVSRVAILGIGVVDGWKGSWRRGREVLLPIATEFSVRCAAT